MNTYKTAEIAKMVGIHPNTVRLYEEWGLIPKPLRQTNGYRVFTDFHAAQFKLARIALQVEVLQGGLRKQAIEIIKMSARGDFDGALDGIACYLRQLNAEKANAEEAIEVAKELHSGVKQDADKLWLTRKEAAEALQVTIDTLRNWELNGLLSVKRRQNGYRMYTSEDMNRLKMIRALRCANYSLSAILRLLNALSGDPEANIEQVLNTPSKAEDIISVCDKLIVSLKAAQINAGRMRDQLEYMKLTIY